VRDGTALVHRGSAFVHDGTAFVHRRTAFVHHGSALVHHGSALVRDGPALVDGSAVVLGRTRRWSRTGRVRCAGTATVRVREHDSGRQDEHRHRDECSAHR
jgi:hypothetical protein